MTGPQATMTDSHHTMVDEAPWRRQPRLATLVGAVILALGLAAVVAARDAGTDIRGYFDELLARTLAAGAPNPALYSALLAAIHLLLFAVLVRLYSARTNRDFAFLGGACSHAALVGFVGDGGNVIGDFLGIVGIAHVNSSQAGVEVGNENNPIIENRRHWFVR